jgi:hypothetical protein
MIFEKYDSKHNAVNPPFFAELTSNSGLFENHFGGMIIPAYRSFLNNIDKTFHCRI